MQALLDNLNQALRRDRKKSVVMCILLVVLVVLSLRSRGRLPVPAAADTAVAIIPSEQTLSVPDIARSANWMAHWRHKPVGHLRRNLFASELNRPPVEPAEPSDPAEPRWAPEDGLFWRGLERALASRADREQYRQSLAETALRDAGRLSLSSTVTGPDPQALIADKVFRIGDAVPVQSERGPFTLVAIEHRRVILSRDHQRVALRLGEARPRLLGGAASRGSG